MVAQGHARPSFPHQAADQAQHARAVRPPVDQVPDKHQRSPLRVGGVVVIAHDSHEPAQSVQTPVHVPDHIILLFPCHKAYCSQVRVFHPGRFARARRPSPCHPAFVPVLHWSAPAARRADPAGRERGRGVSASFSPALPALIYGRPTTEEFVPSLARLANDV